MALTIMGAEVEGGQAWKVGSCAHSEGQKTLASGTASHAEGNGTNATGNYSHAEGSLSTASGACAHAEGFNGSATADYAHTEGGGNTASGFCSHAEGNSTTAAGSSSHAEGYLSAANGTYSHADGSNTNASGNNSYAGGVYATATGVGAFSRGSVQPSVIATNRAQYSVYTLGAKTTDATTTQLTFDAGGTVTTTGATTNTVPIPLYSTYLFNLTIVSRRATVGTSSQGWVYNGLVARDSASARVVGTITQTSTWSDTALGTVAISAGATNTLVIQVTGQAGITLNWHAVLTVNELTAV